MSIEWLGRGDIMRAGQQRLRHGGVVIDAGPGLRPQSLNAERHHLIEPHPEYAAVLAHFIAHDNDYGPHYLLHHCAWDALLPLLADQSVDSVVAVDFIEHLTINGARDFIRHARRIARHQVALFTPLGAYPQDFSAEETKDERDQWGLHGRTWQTHKSSWTPADFEALNDDWQIVACDAFHTADGHGRTLNQPIGVFWAFWERPL